MGSFLLVILQVMHRFLCVRWWRRCRCLSTNIHRKIVAGKGMSLRREVPHQHVNAAHFCPFQGGCFRAKEPNEEDGKYACAVLLSAPSLAHHPVNEAIMT